MDRGAWGAMVHGVAKELDTTERLDNMDKIRAPPSALLLIYQSN